MIAPTPCFALAALLLISGAARAAEAGECGGYGDLKGRTPLAMGRIVGPAARTAFVKSPLAAKGCPDATDACRDTAYLVPGDPVIVGAVRDGFTCVDYVAAGGDDRAGWVSTAGVVRDPDRPVLLSDWTGAWARQEAAITLEPVGNGRLAIKGNATWGARDPDRVKRGAVNLGDIVGRMAPEGDRLAFDMGSGGASLPVDRGDDGDCKIWMRRVGPYLLVDDNGGCGGMNVTFRGIYKRKA